MVDNKEENINDIFHLKTQLNDVKQKLEKYRAKTNECEKLYGKIVLKIQKKCNPHQWGEKWYGWNEEGYTCKICGLNSWDKF